MTVNTATCTATYTGNTVTTVFAVPFYFLANADLVVQQRVAATGVVNTLVLNSDYTLSGAGNESGGSLTATVAPAAGDTLYIARNVAFVQNTAYPSNSPFPAASHEQALDRLTMISQQIQTALSLALQKAPLAGIYDLQGNTLINEAVAVNPADVPNLSQVQALIVAGAAPQLALPVGGSFVGFQQNGTGAVARTVLAKEQDIVNVFDFIPVALQAAILANTSSIDVSAYVQAACNTGAATVRFSSGTFTFNSTVAPLPDQVLQGDANGWGTGTVIKESVGFNNAAFKFTHSGALKNFSFSGSATSLLTAQRHVYINNTNGVTLEDCFFQGAYDAVYIDGSSFYTTLNLCRFYTNVNTQLSINSATAAGVDIILHGCRFLSHNGPYCVYINGLGSLIGSDCQFSTNTATTATVLYDTPATNFGGAQWTGCVFENSGAAASTWIRGTSSLPWRYIKYTNCQITAGTGAALRMDFTQGVGFTDCLLSGSAGTGAFFIPANVTVTDFCFNNCDFEGVSTTSPVQCAGPTALSGSFIIPRWSGAAPMIDYSAASAGNVGYINVIGGNWGSSGIPVKLTSPATIPGFVIGATPWTAYTPTVTSGSGTFTTVTATGAYQKIGKVIHFQVAVVVSTQGTASGATIVSLPTANAGPVAIANGRAITVSAKALQGYIPSTSGSCFIFNYDGSTPSASGETLVINGTYQVA